ncbi:MAG: cobalt ECF transporter T component CbiQ [Candidatus Lokiarchaeota archaeon]|nr:cobalt ECF transporter T component CbiQ [Candidatus Harpocratesius repetitus]
MSLVNQINQKFQNYLAYELDHTRNSFFFAVSPVIKLIVTIGFIILTNNVITKACIWLGLSIIIILSNIGFRNNNRQFFKFVLVLGIIYPFLIAIPLIFFTSGTEWWRFSIGSLTITTTIEGLQLAVNYFLRILTTIIIISFLICSTPFIQIIHALRQMRIPSIVSSLLILTYRYFFFFFDNLVTLLRADATRHLQKLPFKARFIHLSNLFGHLLLQSIHQGASIHRAMIARGYHGEFPLLEFSINPKSTLVYLLLTGSGFTIAILVQFSDLLHNFAKFCSFW